MATTATAKAEAEQEVHEEAEQDVHEEAEAET